MTTTPRTLYEKIWEHIQDDGRALLYIDRHIIHEATSAQAFESLRETGRMVRRSDITLATTDHIVPTSSRRAISSVNRYYDDPKTEELCVALESNAREYGLQFFGITDQRQGIVHVIAPEQGFILPGITCVCGDSHTSTHGAFGALAFGIGTSEVEHVLATQTLLQKKSKSMRIAVEGELHEGVTSKDVIMYIIGQIGTAGGTGCVIEYSGSVFRNFSMEARMSVCNMSIEAGARAGMVAPDETTFEYLKGRPFAPQPGAEWDNAVEYWRTLHSDEGAHFDVDITINAADISPCVTWGTSPQDVVPVTGSVPHPDSFTDARRQSSVRRSLEYMALEPGTRMEDIEIDKVFIGSCTNSRIEDLRSVASLILAAGPNAHVTKNVYAMIVPGSGIVKNQAEAEGLDVIFKRAGFDWREAGCSMCCGLNQDRLDTGQRCASTSNRNFEGRQGSGGRTHLLSPAMAAAAALNGKLTDVRKYPHSKSTGSISLEITNSADFVDRAANPTTLPATRDAPISISAKTTSPASVNVPKFTVLKGIAAPLEKENIDTDVIISVQFLTGIKRTGFGKHLFHALRFSPQTGEKTDFVLNNAPYDKSSIIVCTGANFGCGSSREAAPWSLKEFGIKCIIAPSFAEIFENNCFKNGMLPITLPSVDCELLHGDAISASPLEVDLERLEIRRGNGLPSVTFQVDPFRRYCLLEGLDDIGLTFQKEKYIQEFEVKRSQRWPWLDAGLQRRSSHPTSEGSVKDVRGLAW
ncbi:aconitase family-domain-containing protein [Hysterangium stoloniferum]|nr:aconitase family-domain-containing protein [Hysterangium stoloniferum]